MTIKKILIKKKVFLTTLSTMRIQVLMSKSIYLVTKQQTKKTIKIKLK
jgi:hypothetical protein